MVALLKTLIDKTDNFEIIRDRIAVLIAEETANQVRLAKNAGMDYRLWELKVFSERSNPWDVFLKGANPDTTPVCNVWFNNSNFDQAGSNVVEQQKTEGVFNIDVYGCEVTKAKLGGQVPGDEAASKEAHRAIKLVRNILMSSQNTYLQLRGMVWRRFPDAVTIFQPEIKAEAKQVVGARLSLRVTFSEYSPQYSGDNIELISVVVNRAEDGSVVAEKDFDFT